MKLKLNEEDYEAVRNLYATCYEKQKIYLKLELDFKKWQIKKITKEMTNIPSLFFNIKSYENEDIIPIDVYQKYQKKGQGIINFLKKNAGVPAYLVLFILGLSL